MSVGPDSRWKGEACEKKCECQMLLCFFVKYFKHVDGGKHSHETIMMDCSVGSLTTIVK